MQTKLDTATVDLTRTRAKLCREMRFNPQVYDNEVFYHLELSAKSQYFRIGYPEYVFLSLLDGDTTFSEALALTARQLGPAALTQQQALSLYQWALESGAADFAEDASSAAVNRPTRSSAMELLQKCNPLWLKIPLGRPDAVLQQLQPVIGWMFSPAATIAGLGLILAAVVRLVQDWKQFDDASATVFAPENWLWLLVAWVLLKVCHELAHGMTCRRYGGSVRETGIIFAFFAPLAYVDVTSSWSFPSRWQRIHTAVAGMYVEFLLASISIFVWTHATTPVVSHVLYNIIIMATASTVLFNANPLMKFDGYYILSDLLQIPNLATRASEEMQQWLRGIVFGLPRTTPRPVGSHLWLLRAYGVRALVWRLLVCTTLLIAASVFFHGMGILLALAGIAAWFAMPLWKTIVAGGRLFNTAPARFIRATAVLGTALLMAAGLLLGLPAPVHSTAPGIVSLREGCRLRADVDSFVQEVLVNDGDLVDAGQLLLTLRNDELTVKHKDLELQHQQETIRLQTAMKQHDAGTELVSRNNLRSLQDRLAETSRQTSALLVRAPVSGRVVARNSQALLGRFVEQGDDLLIVDDLQPREIQMMVHQEDYAIANREQGNDVQLRIGTRPAMTATLVRVTPRASLRLSSPALAATEGGPLPVTQSGTDGDGREELELTEPRFEAVAQLPADTDASQYFSGERCIVSLGASGRSLGQHLYYRSADWLQRQFKDAQEATR